MKKPFFLSVYYNIILVNYSIPILDAKGKELGKVDDKRQSIRAGFAEALPLAIAISAYGLSYGVLATQAHFSLAGTVAMSMLVFSGSVQLVAVAMLIAGANLASILFTTVLLNLRNLLYGAALAEGLVPKWKWRWFLAFGVSDEPFVLGSARFKKTGPDPVYFGVVTGMFYFVWVLSSFLGAYIGNGIDPLRWGLDLAFPVAFAALLTPGLRGKPLIATGMAAAVIALGLEWVKPGNEWTIIAAGVLAPLAGLYVKRRFSHA